MITRDAIGNTAYERLRTVLGYIFPGAAIEDATVDRFVAELWSSYRPEFHSMGVPPPPPGFVPRAANVPATPASALTYYVANARHARDAAPYSEFVGHLPVVRVRLALQDPSPIATRIGTVERDDHLLFTLREMHRQFGAGRALGFDPARVDLITPARRLGHRFGAIAVFLCYVRADDAAPSAYVLEGGLAQGGARVLFPARTMATEIVQQSGYTPTFSSAPHHWYHGRLTMRAAAPDEPDWLTVTSRETAGAEPYITISVQFETVTEPPAVLPIQIFVAAGMRVAAVANALGQQVPEMHCELIQRVMGELGLATLDWVTKPHLV